jgi:cysteine desulfurase
MSGVELPIYLDHNATTPLLPEVVDAMLPYLRGEFGNPSSDHPWGRRAKEAVEQARSRVAGLLGCDAEEIVFTSGGTEANNLAIRGVADAASIRRRIMTSVIEHPATSMPCRHLETQGWQIEWSPVDSEARVRLDHIGERLSEATQLVTIMHANNETGTIQPIREIAELAHRHGVLVHTDAAQSVGKVAVNVAALGVDLLTVAGHKLNAPKGVGALFVRRGTAMRPFVLGASHERGLRPGTENVAGIVGLGVACDVAASTVATKTFALAALRDRLWTALREAIPEVRANGDGAERLPNTLSVRFPSVRGSELLAATPEIAASTGSACHAGRESASGVLLAMGLGSEEALGTVRLSIGSTTTAEEIELAARALVRSFERATGRASESKERT